MTQANVDKSLSYAHSVMFYDISPENVLYDSNESNSSTSSNISWFVNSPGDGLLLDPLGLVEYEVTISSTVAGLLESIFQGRTGQTNDPTDYKADETAVTNAIAYTSGWCKNTDAVLAPRANYTINGCIENLVLTINSQTFTSQPMVTVRDYDRMYMSKEESESFATIGSGFFDDGCFFNVHRDLCLKAQAIGNPTFYDNCIVNLGMSTTLAYQANGTAVGTCRADTEASQVNFLPAHPFHDMNYNNGFTKRIDRLRWHARRQYNGNLATGKGEAAAAGELMGYASKKIVLKMYEPIPIAPFYSYANRDLRSSIPHIKTLSLVYQLHANYKNLFLQSNLSSLTDQLTVDFYTVKPKLLLKWITPPRGYSIPKSVSIPIWKENIYSQSNIKMIATSESSYQTYVGAADRGASSTTISANNIRLEQIGKYTMIKVVLDHSKITSEMKTETNASIVSISISLDGASGKLLNATPAQLYEMTMRNITMVGGTRLSFHDWFYHCCLVIFHARDIGVYFGCGIDHGLTIHITMVVVSYNYNPSMGPYTLSNIIGGSNQADTVAEGAYKLYITSVYDRYTLTLNSDGGSSLTMLKIPKDSVGTGAAAALLPGSKESFAALKI